MAGSKKALGILFGVKGGSNISADSGKLILDDLRKIVNQINNNRKLLPKVILQIDTSKSIKKINQLHKALKNLQQQAQNINMPSGGGGKGGKSSAYTQNLAEAKKYFKELKALQKAAARTADVNADASTGAILGLNGDNYKNHYNYFRKLESKYASLSSRLGKTGQDAKNEAKSLGITIDEYNELSKVIEELSEQSGIAFDKIKIDASAAWQKQASNVSDSIHRVYDTISKDPAVKKLADDLLEITKQGSGNVEELKQKFQEFNLLARQNGADIETWGQKFKKAFANQVRSALASLITVDLGRILKGVYDNVVALDDAVVNLQIASGKSRTETKALVKEYAALAKQLKATTAEVAASADTWLRQGYSTKKAQTLITNSMMLSKLGQIEAEEAATALTSAMKGYNVTVEDSVSIVDKLTAVDMEAAASAGGIATAMAETSASANLAGVSMDTLIGYIATVKEVTQDADESVGTFFKTMLARMGNIKVGKFVDENGESLNDVEAVLDEVGIKLRSSNDQFRDFSEVLDEVGSKWNGYNEVQKHAIATAVAGTRQQEKFLVLMSNYETALGYANTAMEANGTAAQKYEAYTQGVTGAIQGLKAAFEELSLTTLDSDLVVDVVNLGTGLLDILAGVMSVVDSLGGLRTALIAVSGIVLAMKYKNILTVLKNIKGGLGKIKDSLLEIIANFAVAKVQGLKGADLFRATFSSIKVGAVSAKAAIIGLTIAVTALVAAYNAYVSSKESSMVANLADSDTHLENAKKIKEERQQLHELIEEYEKLGKVRGGTWGEEAADRVREIQSDITNLVGEQAKQLDLVNGALETQRTLLQGIASDKYEQEYAEALIAVASAKLAYDDQVALDAIYGAKVYDVDAGQIRNDAFKDLLDKYEIESNKWSMSAGGAASTMFGIEYKFEDMDDFVSQYKKVKDLQLYLAEEDRYLSSEYTDAYRVITEYIDNYKEIFDTYSDAAELSHALKSVLFPDKTNSGVEVQQKKVIDILNSVQPAYDAISDALANLTSNGYLTADSLEALYDIEDDLGDNFSLKDILTEEADGFTLASDALEQYVNALIEAEIAATKVDFATRDDAKNAVANLENLIRVLATLAATQDDATNAAEKYRDELEAQRDAFDDQLDNYKKLIDLRKDLLESYADELDYQKELEKKQQNVASLQTKLAVARLDDSAAGQARVRELESQLKEAQEDLEDFTLEHAIDEILEGLDNQSSEYENFIKKELEKIEEALKSNSNAGIGLDVGQIKVSMDAVKQAILDIKEKAGWLAPERYDGLSKDEIYSQATQYIQEQGFTAIDLNRSVDSKLRELAWAYRSAGGDPVDFYDIAAINEGLQKNPPAVVSDGLKQQIESDVDAYIKELLSKAGLYHSGGFVGGSAGLQSNEEFAKLMKTEFVSTPSQIRNFMTKTLPQIASIGKSGSSHEFNAPLVEINCESVTTESMPQLKQIVDEAVGEIKKCLDSGMSRTGYRRTVKKLLT